jgi:hypothetical protein
MKYKYKIEQYKTFNKGDIIKIGRYKNYTLEVVKDNGDELVVINQTKNYKKDPYTIRKCILPKSITNIE